MHHGISSREDEASVISLRGRAGPEIAVPSVDLNDLNSPHALAVLAIPPGSTVLDVGCGSGVVARALAARGCKVWGLEIDPRRASSARHHCVEVLEADVESVTLSAAFAGITFDAVLFLDVLEHLRDPQAALAGAAAVLAPGGSVLMSIPNVTHGALRLELLSGKFRYRPSGLLDRGHLRFFDSEGVDELIRQAGFSAETTLRVIRRLDQTEFDIDLANVPSGLRTALEGDADALTYQFFVIARPARKPHSPNEGVSLLERQRARIDELAAAIEKGAKYARHLEAELAAKDARLRDIEGVVATAERAREAGEVQLREAQTAVAAAARELDARDARLREVQQSLADSELEREARDARVAELQKILADMARITQDTDSYVHHLEGELRKRAGDIAIRDDAMSVLRTHVEKVEKTLSMRDGEIASRDRELAHRDAALAVLHTRLEDVERLTADREARLQAAELSVAEGQGVVAHLSWVVQQPRHRLAENSANALRRRMPLLHRLLRPLVLLALRDSPPSVDPRRSGAD